MPALASTNCWRLAGSSLVVVAALASGCTRPIACVEDGCADDSTTDADTDTGTDTGEDAGEVVSEPLNGGNRNVDILFVIDNSGSMGEEQAILAANVGSFIEVLEAPDVQANYRIGITTTDNGNPWCPNGATTPEAGKLVLSSCKDRINDFYFNNTIDVQDLACNDICSLDAAELQILPTTTQYDGDAKPRPWLENIEGQKNIPATTSTAAAFACFGPQGINGCGFESQLESMYLALVRAQNFDEVSYGFMRPDAVLAVVFVTDEADCSSNKDWSSIFDADGNKVFWSDPTSAFPTSAVCWNAGVECSGDPSNYDSCDAVNKDVNGNSGVADAAAVLHPMSRYMDLLDGIEQDKQPYIANERVIVALIGGVQSSGQVYYADASGIDPVFQDSFGVGPGCQAPNPLDPGNPVQAVPPVRLRELTDAFTPGNMFSICEQEYSTAFEAIAGSLRTQVEPSCFSKCVADTNPMTEIVDVQCTVEQDPPGPNNTSAMEECLRDGDGYVVDPQTQGYSMPNVDTNVCFATLVDPTGQQSSDPLDDMDVYCVDQHNNLQFEVARRVGFAQGAGTTITASCVLSEFPGADCPGIGAP